MSKPIEAIESAQLSAVTGGVGWTELWQRIKPYLPSPTIPLGPFYPPKDDGRWIAGGGSAGGPASSTAA